jgi:hypothetical protein
MLVVRVTENVGAVQSSYYSSCPCLNIQYFLNYLTLLFFNLINYLPEFVRIGEVCKHCVTKI